MKHIYNVFIQPKGEDVQPRKIIFIGTYEGASAVQVKEQLKSLPKDKKYITINACSGIIY